MIDLDRQQLQNLIQEAHAQGLNLNEYLAMLIFDSVGTENPQ
jgi:hypothetical protein